MGRGEKPMKSDKRVDEEFEKLLDEIPNATSSFLQPKSTHQAIADGHGMHTTKGDIDPSPFYGHRIGLYSDGSSSTSSSPSGNSSRYGGYPFGDDVDGMMRRVEIKSTNTPFGNTITIDPYTMRSPIETTRYGGVPHTLLPNLLQFDERKSSVLPQLPFDYPVPNRLLADHLSQLCGSSTSFRYGDGLVGSPQLCGHGGGIGDRYLVSSNYRQPAIADTNLISRQIEFNRKLALLNGTSYSEVVLPEEIYRSTMRDTRNIKVCNFEDSLIIEGKGSPYVRIEEGSASREMRGWQLNSCLHGIGSRANLDRRPTCRLPPLNYDCFVDMDIYNMLKDQRGCRFLQQKIDEGDPKVVSEIYNEAIAHVVELVVDPFANYLMQRLLEVCSNEQRAKILLALTKEPTCLFRTSLNIHGVRVVKKLIDTVKSRRQKERIIWALKPGFLDLIKDMNGNRVIQHCLKFFSNEHTKFIFYGAAMHCVEIACHKIGCVALQDCILLFSGEQRAKLGAEIALNGLQLAQDAYGNYVIQYILGEGYPSANAILASRFKRNYVQLSKNKFSSHVVELCLTLFAEEDKARIVKELLSVTPFGQLIQDPYANYVVKKALDETKGHLHAELVRAIRPHGALRTNPHCKQIFSRSPLKI